jgi:lipopolysaccharide export system permease protein
MFGRHTLRTYVARRFTLMITATFGLCAILIFMIDIVELLRQAGKFGRVPTFEITMMAILRLPAYTEILLPFCVLVGAIGALLLLSRKSELAVMRASGMSAWQFVIPGVLVAVLFGLFAVVVYNPVAAWARAESERRFAEAFGREASVLRSEGGGAWLRQDGPDGPSVMSAATASPDGRKLYTVMVLQYDRQGRFVERVDGRQATLLEGHWSIDKARVWNPSRAPAEHDVYLVSTWLTPERVTDALGTSLTLSVWDLPGLIEVTEKAGLSASRFRVQYETLLARPILLMVMVLLAATVSLRSFRGGGIQTMVMTGMIGGFGFFLLAEISRQIGVSGLAPPVLAVWVPVAVAGCGALTVLLHQEDG